MKEMTAKIEQENKELKRLTKRLVEARKTQKKLNEGIAQLRQNDNLRVTTQAIVHSSAQHVTNSIEFPDEIDNTIAADPFTASKQPKSSSEDENSDKGKLQSKKKENSPTDVPVVRHWARRR
jgi:chromosome segregation ATPase